MQNETERGFESGSAKRITIISIFFIVFGIALIPMSITAIRSGQPIPLLSRTRPVYGGKVLRRALGAELIGVGGLWAASRRRRRRLS